jgi:hypothetical protein
VSAGAFWDECLAHGRLRVWACSGDGRSGQSGISERGVAPAPHEGHAALSPCRLRLSGKQGGEMPSGGGHTAAVRALSGTSAGVRGERVSSQQLGSGRPIATSTRRMAHEEELGGGLDGRACR